MSKLATLMGVAAAFALIIGFATSAHAVPIGDCDNADIVGGVGSGGVFTPSAGAGWDVGTGQCNGDFETTIDAFFPSGAPSLGGNGLELGMRAEQRSIGQILPTDHVGNDYKVQTGADPTRADRAWWNIQHSIAYDGNVDDLDTLEFFIRTDDGSSVWSGLGGPLLNMLALRGGIDDRQSYIRKLVMA